MSSVITKGKFVWYDLMTTDLEAAQQFYTRLIGWGTQDFEGGDKPYTMWTVGERPIGGSMALPEEAKQAGVPPHWLGFVTTTDVDETVKQAEGGGAIVRVPGTDIPTVGRFAILSDPQGAVFAVFSPSGDSPGSSGDPGSGEVSWHELATEDLEAGWSFYQDLFGWSITEDMDMGEAGLYRMYGVDEAPIGGMYKRPPELPTSAWLFYIKVDDLDAAVTRVKELGGQILNGPMEVPGGDRIAQCMDPQGGAFALHASKA